MSVSIYRAPAALGLLLCPLISFAQGEAPTVDSGDTAWIIAATALVLFMTLPGLALFYAGLVRTKNVLSILMQCFAITGVVSLLWLAVGYSLVFTDGGAVAFTLSRPADETRSEAVVVVTPDGQAHRAEIDAMLLGAEFPAELELKVAGLRLSSPRGIDRSCFRLRVMYDVAGPGAAGAAPRAAFCEAARY